jgi:transcription antitermination protein NusB
MGETATANDSQSSGKRTRTRRTDTKDPRRARERALKILFQADVRGVTPDTTLRRLTDDPAARAMLDEVEDLTAEGELLPAQQTGDAAATTAVGRSASTSGSRGRPTAGIDGFTRSLVLGVADNQPRIDALIGRFARRWQIHRMPVVDRNVLRLATYELLYETTSPAVVINEAVNLAKALSTDDSGRYVNGVLEAIRKHLADGDAVGAEGAPGDGEGSPVDAEVTPGDGEGSPVDAEVTPGDGEGAQVDTEVTLGDDEGVPDDAGGTPGDASSPAREPHDPPAGDDPV